MIAPKILFFFLLNRKNKIEQNTKIQSTQKYPIGLTVRSEIKSKHATEDKRRTEMAKNKTETITKTIGGICFQLPFKDCGNLCTWKLFSSHAVWEHRNLCLTISIALNFQLRNFIGVVVVADSFMQIFFGYTIWSATSPRSYVYFCN